MNYTTQLRFSIYESLTKKVTKISEPLYKAVLLHIYIAEREEKILTYRECWNTLPFQITLIDCSCLQVHKVCANEQEQL